MEKQMALGQISVRKLLLSLVSNLTNGPYSFIHSFLHSFIRVLPTLSYLGNHQRRLNHKR